MKKLTVAFVAMLLFAACQHENAKAPDEVALLKRDVDNQTVTTKQEEEKKPTSGNVNNDVDKQQQDQKPKQTQQRIPVPKEDWDKKIIKTASLNLEIKDFKTYNSTFRDNVKQVGGYIAQEQQAETEYKIENTLTIKVPVDQFDEAVQLLTKDVQKLNEKRITSDDVTTEFVDTRSRLEAKKQVRLRYLDLLKQAKNMEEILNVQSEINGIQEEIESASGRIEYLSYSSSFSTINLTFYQILNATVADPAKPSFSTKFSAAFKEGWSWIQEVFIIVVSIWPLLLAIPGVYIIYRRTKKPKIKAA
jgi:hypothetical protein